MFNKAKMTNNGTGYKQKLRNFKNVTGKRKETRGLLARTRNEIGSITSDNNT